MCARYNLRISPQKLAEIFSVVRGVEYQPRFNIAPTQTVVAIRQQKKGRIASHFRWGLVPPWSKDPKAGAPLINARAESRRCLIPATGFYEWEHRGKLRLPYHIHLPGDEPFALAGIWETWKGNGDPLESCAIITTDTSPQMAVLHDRMPVLLHREDWPLWLDPDIQQPEVLQPLLRPWDGPLELQPIDPKINHSRNEGAEYFCPMDESPAG
jgi:putative SOS response-associated peptidase YedK